MKKLIPLVVVIAGLLVIIYGQTRNNSSETNLVSVGFYILIAGVIIFAISFAMSAKKK